MKYDYTTNLGNEIQSIAARRFLPEIDCYVDHEKLNLFESDEKVKLIMNGWYLDCLKSWPPSDSIDPLLISMHFNTSVNETKEVILSKESREFFSSYGPVGCRDQPTAELLKENDIDAYFSGCLSLTLEGMKKNTDYKYVVVNSQKSEEIVNYLKSKTELDIFEVFQDSIFSLDKKYLDQMPRPYRLTPSFFKTEDSFHLAESILNLYENATCVITDRLHCTFPCLALKTPVLFINTAKFGLERLNDVGNLVNETTLDEYFQDYSIFDVEHPRKNPEDYLKIRKSLIDKTKEFTNHISDTYHSYLNYDISYQSNKNLELLLRASYESRKYMFNVMKLTEKHEAENLKTKQDYEKKILNQQSQIEEKEKIISNQQIQLDEQKKIMDNSKQSNYNKLKSYFKKE